MSRDRDVVEKVIASLKNIGQFGLSPLREGNDGACFKAVDPERRIAVSIRTLWPNDLPDGEAHLQQLLAQSRAAQNVEAGNLAKVIGSGDLDGAFFIVSAFIDGHTLRENLRSGDRLGTSDLIDFARQSCDGIESAHSRGLVHHALHPENIVIEFDGSAKILDLALYRRNHPQSDPFHPAAQYLAPEQLAGQGADRATNFYSIALMLYEIATGKLPFQGDSWEALAESARHDLVPPIEVNSTVPPGINAAIMKALSRDRSVRFQNGPDLVRALEDYRSFGRKKVVTVPPVPVAPIVPLAPKPPKAGSLATASLTFAAPAAAPLEANSSRLAVESVMAAAHASAASAAATAPDLITHFSAPPSTVPFKRTPPPVAPAPPPMVEVFMPHDEVHPSKVALAKEALQNLGVNLWEEAKSKARKIDPWFIALTCLIIVLAGFITRTVALSFWGTPHPTDYSSPAPEPEPVAAVKTQPLPPAATAPAEVKPQVADVQSGPPEWKSTPAPQPDRRHPHMVAQAPVKTPVIAAAVQPAPSPNATSPYLGSIMISTTPDGAHVVVDNKANQSFTTPQLISSLSPGVHTLSISKDGYAAATRTVQITAGARSNLAVQLALPSAYLTVLSNPTTAYILIDGVSTGHVTPSQVPVSPGTHTLTLRKMGYLEANDTITLSAGEQQSRNLPLLEAGSTPDIHVAQTGKVRKLFGGKSSGVHLTVHTEPAGATVLINGQTVGKSTPVDFGLNPGNYVIEIELTGYQTLRKNITVEDGSPLVLNETLHP